MAYQVRFTLPERQLHRADIVFKVRRDGKAFGELRVSNGALVWYPRSKRKGVYVRWADLARRLNNQR